MNKHQIKDIKSDIRTSRKLNMEEIYLMAKYCLSTYFYSIKTFGRKSEVTRGVTKAWRTFKDTLAEEDYLTSLMLRHGKKINVAEAWSFLDDLDYANEQTVDYLYRYLDNASDACDVEAAWRAVWEKRDFEMITETYEYRLRLCSMLLGFDDIKKFLGFPVEFWTFIEPRIDFKSDAELPFENIEEYGVKKYVDESGKIFNFRVTLPVITNLDKALFTVRGLEEAYNLFHQIRMHMPGKDLIGSSEEKEEAFKKGYMKTKYKQVFKEI